MAKSLVFPYIETELVGNPGDWSFFCFFIFVVQQFYSIVQETYCQKRMKIQQNTIAVNEKKLRRLPD